MKPEIQDVTNNLLQTIANLTLENAQLKSVLRQYEDEKQVKNNEI